MIITYFRSSSYNCHCMCEMQYYIEYVLGWRGPSGKKADKGTIVHKVLEILAVIKKAQQEALIQIEDDVIGMVDTTNYDLENIIQQVYEYYTSKTEHHKWTDKDFRDCRDWSYKALQFNDGMFDPRNRTILMPEQHFDFLIEKPWAKYSYELPKGEKLSGNLALKGTIDLITLVNDDTIEVIDWKTGRRLDWATGKEKTQEKLEDDAQLRIYHYAIRHLYPQIKNVIFSIYFINDGGPFSICFGEESIDRTETLLRNKFNIIKNTKKPKLNKSWMCSKLCHFGKTTFENTTIEPLTEYRDNQVTKKFDFMTKCEQIKHDLDLNGPTDTIRRYKHPNHTFGSYKAPGSA